jgi:hypothetical protein
MAQPEVPKIPRLDQNLVRPIAVDRRELPRGFYRLISLDLITVLSALGVGYLYSLYLSGQNYFVLLISFLTIFLVASVFGLFLRKNASRRAIILVLEIGALLLPFYDRPYKIWSLAAIIIIIFFTWGEADSRRDIDNNIELRFIRCIRPFLEKATTAIVLAALVIYIPQWDAKNIFVSERVFGSVFDWASGLTGNFYPEFKLNSSVGALAESVARSQVENNPNLKLLSPGDKESAIQVAVPQIIDNFSRSFGTVLKTEQLVSDALYESFISLISKWREKFGNFFLIAWIISVFFLVRIFGVVYYLAVAALSFATYQILLALNVFSLVGETRTHETLEFS